MNLLAIDTATEACSVALYQDGVVQERFAIAPREHTALVLPWTTELLEQAGLNLGELDALAVSQGPGSFTGVRIGLSAAQGLAAGAGLGLLGVSTLEALARDVAESEDTDRVFVALDARMGEIYCAAYDFSKASHHRLDEQVIDPGRIELTGGGWTGAGTGFISYPVLAERLGDAMDSVLEEAVYPHAGQIARMAATRLANGDPAPPPEHLEPVYLRNQVAHKPRS